ncbi:MAG: iron ABC transporter permease [Spirochaetales bacterium]|jgi:iron(III) transport system permease protein|nr:iron ABC transporter permease [Spirochaetales bacterium]
MIKKRSLVKLLVAALLFALGDIWIYTTLRDSFHAYYEENSMKEVSLFARTAPDESEYYQDWIASLSSEIEGGRAMILALDGDADFVPAAGDSIAGAIWDAYKGTEDFEKGLESVYYLLPYKVSAEITAEDLIRLVPPELSGDIPPEGMQVYLLPIPDESGFDITGAVLMAIPVGSAAGFESLLGSLCILAWIIFVTLFAVGSLARDPITGYAIIFLLAVSIAFVAYPLFESFRLTFSDGGVFSLAIWQKTFSAEYLRPFWGSLLLGILTASVSTLIGFAFAFLTERTGIRGKKLIGTLGTMPVISPPFSLTLSLILLFGNNGLITSQLLGIENFSIYGLGGLVLAQTIGMFPIAYMSLSSVLKSIDSTVEDAALDLQASRLRTFLTITLPLSLPGLLSSWLLVFTNSLADFANPLLLAGSYRVLSVEAYIEVTGRNNLGGGAALSLLLLLPTLTAFFAQRYWINKKSFVTVTGKPSTRLAELATKPVRIGLQTFVWLCLAFILALYGTIVAGCFVRNWGFDYSFTLANFGEALSRGYQSIISTVTLAAVATPIAGIIAMAAAVIMVRRTFFGKRILEVLLMTPFAIPGTLLGISYVLAFNKPPLLLIGTAAIIIINYIIRELPVGLETGAASLRQIDPAIEEAAQDLGANTSKVFTSVVLPLIRPAFLTSMSYTFVRAMTAVSAIAFLISARWYHMTMQIYNFSENIRFGLASVLATVLIIIVMGAFGLMQLLVRDKGLTEKNIVR